MADTLSRAQRSALMSRIKSQDTKPEMAVRRLLHGLGYRYVLHDRRLPGRPDLVFPGRRKVIFVHGCFWHAHGCSIASTPRSNKTYWSGKIGGNVRRDATTVRKLRRLGWGVAIVWECDTKSSDLSRLASRLARFLG